MKHKPSLLLTAALSLSASSISVSQANAETGQDPYIDSFQTYAQEVAAVEKKAGYIGKELPIPKAIKVMDGVYTVVGSFIWGTPANFGLNNNLTAMIFPDGVFVYNAGANEAIAYSFHQQIKRLTDKPVKWVAMENNQGHAYMGASYWWDVGVKNLYLEKQATENAHKSFESTKERYAAGRGRAITESAYDVTEHFTTFEGKKIIDVGGGETVELINFGGGHTPTMTGMYVPSKNLLFTGDLGFNERLPGLFHDSHYQEWMDSYDRMVSMVPDDVVVIPGHGTPTDLASLKRQTYDYLAYLKEQVSAIVEAGGTLEDVEAIDQSMYQDRPVFGQLAKPNAVNMYNQMMADKSKKES